MLAAIYARISRDPNHDELGVMRQEADCRALCARFGHEVAAVIVDDDRSAYSGKRRPGFDLLRSMLEQREVGVVVAWHPDRLTRHPRELEDLIDLLERVGATVHTVQAGEYDLSTPSGRMTARIVGSVARHESEHKSARLRRKHEELAAAGKVSGGGDRPFGYAADRVTLVPEEAALIREGVAWLLDGGTLTGLWRDWKRRGIGSPSGNVWTFHGLRRMFLGARIAGKRAHHGVITADAVWPAIITLDEHRRLNAIFSQRMRAKPPRSYPLVGLLFCSTCGGRMVASPKDGKRAYSCAPHVGGCNGRRSFADPLEALILDAVFARLAGAPLATPDAAPLDPIAAELAELDAQVAELGQMWAAREIDRAGWRAASEALAARRSALGASVASAGRRRSLSTLPSDEAALRAAWGSWGIDRQRMVLAEVIGRIELGPARRGYNRFDPARVHVDWLA